MDFLGLALFVAGFFCIVLFQWEAYVEMARAALANKRSIFLVLGFAGMTAGLILI